MVVKDMREGKLLEEAGLNEKKGKLRKEPTFKTGRREEDAAAAAAAKSLQSCPTLCDPINSSPPGSPVPGILQARTLEWVVIAFSREEDEAPNKGNFEVEWSRVHPKCANVYSKRLDRGLSSRTLEAKPFWKTVN